jgi:hypothetical protein
MSDRELIELARKFARGDKQVEKLEKVGVKVRKAMEEYIRTAEGGTLPPEVVREMVEVWIFIGIILAHHYRSFRLETGSRVLALIHLLQLFSPLGLALVSERLRDLFDLIELEEHLRRRGVGNERA